MKTKTQPQIGSPEWIESKSREIQAEEDLQESETQGWKGDQELLARFTNFNSATRPPKQHKGEPLVELYRQTVNELTAQRDELLAALKALNAAVAQLEGQPVEYPIARALGYCVTAAETAIARCEASNPTT